MRVNKNKLTVTQMTDRYTGGSTLEEISQVAGVTKQRIQQILAKHGIRRCHGGAWVRESKTERREKQKLAARDARCQRRWGITLTEWVSIRAAHGPSPFLRFYQQLYNASRRSIPFLLTFREWWSIWQESGRWPERGRIGDLHRYVMARIGDAGPYAIGNVRIVTQSENMIEYHVKRGA